MKMNMNNEDYRIRFNNIMAQKDQSLRELLKIMSFASNAIDNICERYRILILI